MTEKELDLTTCPLQGLNLIEASAGTGKTYAIVGIYLRLLIEKFIPVEKILVVTFTEAATAELKVRITDSIQRLLSVLQSGNTDEPFFRYFLKQLSGHSGKSRISAMRRLQQALFSFDEAPILTIHGFCHKMLSDFALETNSSFDAKVFSSQEALIAESAQDYWRGQVYSTCPDFSREFLELFEEPGDLSKEFNKIISRSRLQFLPHIEQRPFSVFEHVNRLFQYLQFSWNRQEDFLIRWTLENKIWRRDFQAKYFKQVRQYFEDNDPFTSCAGLAKLTSSEIRKKFTGNTPLPEFFEQCDNFNRLKNSLRSAILMDYFQWAKTRLKEKKRVLNVYSFDDLLQDFHSALQRKSGQALAQLVRRRISVALIDEFQDTDPIQYEIFSILFKQGNLFLIGDPKQSIYSFRGADVYAYLLAKKEVRQQFTLSVNWRSDPRLVEAIGHLFSVVKHPFVHESIPWFASRGASQSENRSLYIEWEPVIPMQIWYLQAEKPVKVSEARQRIIDATVAEIIHLLDSGKIIHTPFPRLLSASLSLQEKDISEAMLRANQQSQSLKLADIAVLVRTHREAEQMRDALSQKNIPSILKTQVSIFQTDEFREILTIAHAIAEFHNPALVKGALLTDIMGYSGSRISRIFIEDSCSNDPTLPWEEKLWDRIASQMADYHQQWKSKGFFPMMRAFLNNEEVHKNLLVLPDGERRLTNVLHVIELLHQAESEGQRGMRSLLKWAHEMERGTLESREEYLIRLETDEDALKILTIHSCKGLEFPIVFCPFSWGSRRTNDIFFHDESGHLFWDLEKKEIHQKKCLEESLAEDMRLFYVALTRAKYCCYLAWGHINHSKHSPLTHLFGGGNAWDSLKKLENDSRGTVAVTHLPEWDASAVNAINYQSMECNNRELQFETFQQTLRRQWQITSFSALSTRLRNPSSGILETGQDHDQGEMSIIETGESLFEDESLKEESSGSSLMHFPAGTGTGQCFHELFEQLDFQEQDEKKIMKKVEEKLAKYRFNSQWTDVVFQMTRDTFHKKIPLFQTGESRHQSNSKFKSSFVLADLSNQSVVKEMPFFFPIESLDADRLISLLAECQQTESQKVLLRSLHQLNFKTLPGFMRGFLDVVFSYDGRYYILDWKSNRLGYQREDYAPHLLKIELEKHFYVLQYYIYAVALHRYLKHRLPDYRFAHHFGGVYYFFLRGIQSNADDFYGIYYDSLSDSADVIEKLDAVFQGE